MINKKTAKARAINAIRVDSPKNCRIICDLFAPATFRRPISLERLDDFAVDRFIKLTHAINKTKRAMAVKIKTYFIFPEDDERKKLE